MRNLNLKSLSLYSDSISINMFVGFFIWFAGFFFAFYIYNGIIIEQETFIENQEKILSKSTFSYFKTNFIVYNFIILGFVSLSISSIVILFFNGLILGYFFFNHNLTTSDLLQSTKLILPHFTEIIGFVLAYHISIIISKTIINDYKSTFVLFKTKFIKLYLIGTILILLGAIFEANITILFI